MSDEKEILEAASTESDGTSAKKTELEGSQEKSDAITPTIENVDPAQIFDLRVILKKRATSLRMRSYFALLGSACVIAAAGYLIVYIGEIINNETAPIPRWDQLAIYSDVFETEEAELSTEIKSLQREATRLTGIKLSVPSPEKLAGFDREIDPNKANRELANAWFKICVAYDRIGNEILAKPVTCSATPISTEAGEVSEKALVDTEDQIDFLERESLVRFRIVKSIEDKLAAASTIDPSTGELVSEKLAAALSSDLSAERAVLADIQAQIKALQDRRIELNQAVETKNLRLYEILKRDVDQLSNGAFAGNVLEATSAAQDIVLYISSQEDFIRPDADTKIERAKHLRTTIAKVESIIVDKPDFVFPGEPSASEQWPTLVATAFTRLSILLIMVYLVQILVGLYRYSLRLAAVYDSQADALLVDPGVVAHLGLAVQNTLPKEIDFGKNPTSPSQHIENIVRATVAKVRPKNG